MLGTEMERAIGRCVLAMWPYLQRDTQEGKRREGRASAKPTGYGKAWRREREVDGHGRYLEVVSYMVLRRGWTSGLVMWMWA
jgi:hypothetical protein